MSAASIVEELESIAVQQLLSALGGEWEAVQSCESLRAERLAVLATLSPADDCERQRISGRLRHIAQTGEAVEAAMQLHMKSLQTRRRAARVERDRREGYASAAR